MQKVLSFSNEEKNDVSVPPTALVQRKVPWGKLFKPTVFVVCLLPVVAAIVSAMQGTIGANPVEALLHVSGEWGLRFLLITLCVTPVQSIFKWPVVGKLRRMLGLFSFFYICLHFLIWVVLDQGLDLSAVVADIIDKKYITIGIIVLLGMIPLALTSNRWSIRKLGKRWKILHQMIYPLTVLAIVHFLWQVRANDVLEPAAYLAFLVVLLVWRFHRLLKKNTERAGRT